MIYITIQDVPCDQACRRGARLFCEKHNIDWSRFLFGGGIPVDEVAHIDDAYLKRFIENATKRANQNG
jgi:hypothetical protein